MSMNLIVGWLIMISFTLRLCVVTLANECFEYTLEILQSPCHEPAATYSHNYDESFFF